MADEAGGDDGLAESATKQVFSSYVCRSLGGRGKPHPGDVAEASSLAAVPLPPCSYPLWDALPPDVVASGRLSQLQLEGVLYACNKHCQQLPSGERAGFFIGDGAGVGKGRQIAGVIVDNFARGRKRALWLSTSSDLHADATRDLRDLGCHVTVINNVSSLDRESRALGLAQEYREGVLFMTYSALISQQRGRARLQQVMDWLVHGVGTQGGSSAADGGPGARAAEAAWDGLIVLDECHKAKNFVPGKESASTKVASAVISLQERLPQARVLYASATGVSEVGNMAYMSRMGLWGPGTAFDSFQAFLESMKRRGVSFMEMLAMEMKAEGKYVARGLSFREAEFSEVEAPLNPDQIRMYDNAVQLWQRLRLQLEAACAATGSGRDVFKAYWATLQRFFKLLCVSIKVPAVIAEAREALSSGQCVVIGLQTTGEAAADAVGLEPGPVPGFVSPTKEMLLRFIATHFPTRKLPPGAKGAGAAAAGDVPDYAVGGGGAYGYAQDWEAPEPPPPPTQAPPQQPGQPPPQGEEVPGCVSMRAELLAAAEALPLPPNFLDEIIDALGGPGKVAEMTGRKGRVVRLQPAGGAGVGGGGGGGGGGAPAPRPRLLYELRAKPESNEMDSLNISEKDAFMCGKKLVAIISDAASTGISLHASRAVANQRRRLHLTIELPWSADKAIQQLGRSHRSNQVTAPIYKLMSTRIGGEKRFAAAVARRLQSLGALTRGDRRAASGVDLSASNFDTPLGRKSLRRLYDHLQLANPVLPQGVSLADVFREHPTLAEIVTVPGARKAPRSGAPAASPSAAGSAFDYDDRFVVALHVRALHEKCREFAEKGGLELPPPRKGGERDDEEEVLAAAAAAAAAGGKDGDPSRGGAGDVRKFLNRLLGLRVEEQGVLFSYYAAVLAAEITKARAEGKYSEGLADVAGSRIRLKSRATLWVDPLSRLATTHTAFSVDRGLSWEAAKRRLERERVPGDSSGFRMSRRPLGSSYLVLLAVQKPGSRNTFAIARPNTGMSYFDMDRSDLEAKYQPPPPPGSETEAALEAAWRAAYESALETCSHGPGCRLGPDCQVGRRITSVHVLGGSVVRVWGLLEAALARREAELPRTERSMRVVRVEWDDGEEGEEEDAEARKAQAKRQTPQASPAAAADGATPAPDGSTGSPQITLSGSPSPAGADPPDTATTAVPSTLPRAAAAGPVRRRTSDGGDSDGGGGGGTGGSGGGGGGRPGGGAPPSQQHIVGVRYPRSLLGEVVAALHSAARQATLTQLPSGAIAVRPPPALPGPGAAGGPASEDPTPVDKRAQAQAFRAPKTLMHFFKPAAAATGGSADGGDKPGGGGSGGGGGGGLVLQLPLGARAKELLPPPLPPPSQPAVKPEPTGPTQRPPGPAAAAVGPGAARAGGGGGPNATAAPAAKRQKVAPTPATAAKGKGGGKGAAGSKGQPPPPAGRDIRTAFGRKPPPNTATPAAAAATTPGPTPVGLGPAAGTPGGSPASPSVISIDCSASVQAGATPPPGPSLTPPVKPLAAPTAARDGAGGRTPSGSSPKAAAAAAAAAGAAAAAEDVVMLDGSSDDEPAVNGRGGEGGGGSGGGAAVVGTQGPELRRTRHLPQNGGGGTAGGNGAANGHAAGAAEGPGGGQEEAEELGVEEDEAAAEEGEEGGPEAEEEDGDFLVEELEEEEEEDDAGAVDDEDDEDFVLESEDEAEARRGRGGGGGGGGGAKRKSTTPAGRGPGGGGKRSGAAGGGAGRGGAAGGEARALETLQGMGFGEAAARRALWMAKGDCARAVELCVQGVCK
ncbi:hypothetical protein HYH03_001479 [Edaphochlamys debaryana]|uniref:Uncharacterized protein n=1 Tax=Edaphochlamys debaryana TaxID=47281 RepID=A0A835YFC1_9CHLO|nr:hypothetical protein HYH03_001479 [Edaphochlamys debaryana]|eukprot:KAG2500714.1 hypothetical protein HYH03_001479 [Edaphochlamys debaryana]